MQCNVAYYANKYSSNSSSNNINNNNNSSTIRATTTTRNNRVDPSTYSCVLSLVMCCRLALGCAAATIFAYLLSYSRRGGNKEAASAAFNKQISLSC